MPGNLEIEKIRYPLPTPKSFKEQSALDKRKDKISARQVRKTNYKESLEEKIVMKNTYGLLLFGNTALTLDEAVEFKITPDEVKEI